MHTTTCVLVAGALALSLAAATPANANDSEAETSLGGLTLLKSDAISMDSEDLFISRDVVRVKYRFTNTSDAQIETTVAFPLPDIPPTSEEAVRYWGSAASGLKFRTKVDGGDFPLQLVEQAIFKDRDVTSRLTALRIPPNHFADGFDTAINQAPKSERDRLVADGLIRQAGVADQPVWNALWSVRTTVTRRQTFPAKTTVAVEHEYAPLAGGSVGGGLDPSARTGESASYFAQTRRKYCIDDDWLKSFDRRFRNRKSDNGGGYS